jgi:hypothetical protein
MRIFRHSDFVIPSSLDIRHLSFCFEIFICVSRGHVSSAFVSIRVHLSRRSLGVGGFVVSKKFVKKKVLTFLGVSGQKECSACKI